MEIHKQQYNKYTIINRISIPVPRLLEEQKIQIIPTKAAIVTTAKESSPWKIRRSLGVKTANTLLFSGVNFLPYSRNMIPNKNRNPLNNRHFPLCIYTHIPGHQPLVSALPISYYLLLH